MNDWSMLKKLIWLHIVKGGGGIERTVKGAIVHVINALARPAISVKCEVNPIQDLHGYDSPWPAGGGRNKLPPHYVGSTSSAGITCTYNADESITVQGDPTANFIYCDIYGANSTNISTLRPLLDGLTPGGPLTMTIDGNPSGIDLICQFNKADGTLTTGRTTSSKKATTVPADAVYMFVALRVQKSLVTPPINATVRVLVGNGSTVEDYSHYSNICPISGRTSATIYHSGADTSNPTTYTIQLGDTVYGGKLDVTTGVLTVTWGMVDYANITWGNYSQQANGAYYMQSAVYPTVPNQGTSVAKMCDSRALTNKSAGQIPANCVKTAWGTFYYTSDKTTKDAALAEIEATPVHVVYELATPFEITLTPTQIEMLLGENNLWADAGDLTLTYYADGNASTSEALGILLGGTYNNPSGADDVSDDEALEILLGGS